MAMPETPDNPIDPGLESLRELVVLELAHRIKNVYAVVGGVLALSARADPQMRPLVNALRDRIAALEAAHTHLIDAPARPPAPEAHTVMGLLRLLIAPFDGGEAKAIVLSGGDGPIDWRPGATLALIVRELSTNSVKYGALSTDDGHVAIDCSENDGRYIIDWRESGGPEIWGPPEKSGFGTLLMERAAAAAGLSVTKEWRREGLAVLIVIPLEDLQQ